MPAFQVNGTDCTAEATCFSQIGHVIGPFCHSP
jgi:hypothetical protein